MRKQYTLEVVRKSNGIVAFMEDYETKEEVREDLKLFNKKNCEIHIYFSLFNGTDLVTELDVERF